MTEDEILGCHHRLDGHEFEQALGNRADLRTPSLFKSLSSTVFHNFL